MNLTKNLLWCALAGLAACGGSTSSSQPSGPSPEQPASGQGDLTFQRDVAGPTSAEAKAFVAKVDADLRRLIVAQSQAEWTKQTDITDEHEATAAQAGAELMNYITQAIKEARKFEGMTLDADTKRQLTLLRLAGQPAPDDKAEADELATVMTKMDGTYGKSKACDAKGKCRDLGQLEDVLAKSRKPAELLAAWQGWHEATGRAVFPMYKRFVELANVGAKGVGYANVGDMWRSSYDMPPDAFAGEVDRLWQQVAPLYQDLHCYARRQLNKKYGDKVVAKDQPIPAHLLGNMWAQSWGNLYPEFEPYKGVSSLDVTPALKKQKYDPIKMVKLGESFFTSLGMNSLPETFWQNSMFVKPAGKEVVCHASAWDVTYNNDVRIKMCIKQTQDDLVTIHHELGHDYYFNSYYKLPMLYQNGANDGFHEAIGDTIALSMTPEYLQKVGLLGKVVKNEKATINEQMNIALDKIAFLPFGLLVDKWRWGVFSGEVKPDDYNAFWWKLRRKYQGVMAPIARGPEDFDPGAKYHVPGNTPYMRYFLSTILQFQFHKALCQKAGFTGPLHECSIYGNKEAGAALMSMLALGASKPWTEAYAQLTGQNQLDASAITEYFAPLSAWLKEQNQGQSCGWSEE